MVPVPAPGYELRNAAKTERKAVRRTSRIFMASSVCQIIALLSIGGHVPANSRPCPCDCPVSVPGIDVVFWCSMCIAACVDVEPVRLRQTERLTSQSHLLMDPVRSLPLRNAPDKVNSSTGEPRRNLSSRKSARGIQPPKANQLVSYILAGYFPASKAACFGQHTSSAASAFVKRTPSSAS